MARSTAPNWQSLVFRDPQALEQLEDIVHPLVGQAVDIFVRRASQKVVVIEAIKLLESRLENILQYDLGDVRAGRRAGGTPDAQTRHDARPGAGAHPCAVAAE